MASLVCGRAFDGCIVEVRADCVFQHKLREDDFGDYAEPGGTAAEPFSGAIKNLITDSRRKVTRSVKSSKSSSLNQC